MADHHSSTTDRRKPTMSMNIQGFAMLMTLPLLVLLLLSCFFLLRGMHTILEDTTTARVTYLPEILESQRTTVNIEAMRRQAAISFFEHEAEERRRARLTAQTLGTETSLNPDSKFRLKMHSVHDSLNRLEEERNALDALQEERNRAVEELDSFTQELGQRVFTRPDRGEVFVRLFPLPYIHTLYAVRELDRLNDIHAALREHIDRRAPQATGTVRRELDSLRSLLTRVIHAQANVITQRERAALSWIGIDTTLRNLRDELNINAVDNTYRILLSIDDQTSRMWWTVVVTCVIMLAACLSLIGLFHTYIVRPVTQMSAKLQDIRTGKESPPMPPRRIAELDEVATLINISGDQIALLYRQARALEKEKDHMENMAITDALTGIYNRRYFDVQYARLHEDALRMHRPLSVILFDIDFFKKYNDTLGHAAGDACLKAVAQALRDSLHRQTDMAFRYGGEEFVVLLPACQSDMAVRLAEDIRHSVEALGLSHPASDVSQVVTVSVGTATLSPDHPVDQKQLLEQADAAMYRAKSSGRNTVCAAPAIE